MSATANRGSPKSATRGGFPITVFRTGDELARAAASCVTSGLRQKQDLMIAAATGGSPTRTYEFLVQDYRKEPDLFKKLRIHKLDEWGDLDADDPGSCEAYLQQHLLAPLQIGHDRYFGFRPNPPDPAAECRRVSQWLYQNGPVDICILGLGLNGHLALNEPADFLAPFSHKAVLTEESKRHPMLAIARKSATYGMGLGFAEIFASKQILLLVNGALKAKQLRRLLEERRVYTQHPASFLWLHPNVACLCDEAAAAEGDLTSLEN
jgi:galactosamine-6-phosphate isomerase